MAVAAAADTATAWKVIGPGGGGAQYIPTVSPHDPRKVLAACDMTGSYLSQDGGASWRIFNLGEPTRQFVWDPTNPRVVYARGSALYRSEDGGSKWSLVYPARGAVSSVDMASDHAEVVYLVDGKPAARMTAMAVDPDKTAVLYAGMGTGFLVSMDRGAKWAKEFEMPRLIRKIWAAGGVVYAATDQSVWRKVKGAWSEGAVSADPWLEVAGSGEVVYAVSAKGGASSSDGGRSWRAVTLPGSGARPTSVATSAAHPDTAYLGFGQMDVDGRGLFGVAKSIGRGQTWRLVWAQGTVAPGNVTDARITPKLGAGRSASQQLLPDVPHRLRRCYSHLDPAALASGQAGLLPRAAMLSSII